MYCIILLKSMYWVYSSKILADYFSTIKIILWFLSLQISVTSLHYVISWTVHQETWLRWLRHQVKYSCWPLPRGCEFNPWSWFQYLWKRQKWLTWDIPKASTAEWEQSTPWFNWRVKFRILGNLLSLKKRHLKKARKYNVSISGWKVVIIATKMGCPCGVMVKSLDSGIVVSEFKLQLCYYIHFWRNTLGKGMNPFILLAKG